MEKKIKTLKKKRHELQVTGTFANFEALHVSNKAQE